MDKKTVDKYIRKYSRVHVYAVIAMCLELKKTRMSDKEIIAEIYKTLGSLGWRKLL